MDKNDIRRMLEEEGVPFDIFDHPAVYTVEEAATLFLPADAMMEIIRQSGTHGEYISPFSHLE